MSAAIEDLIEASRDGDLARVKQHIESGVDVNARGNHGNTALVSPLLSEPTLIWSGI